MTPSRFLDSRAPISGTGPGASTRPPRRPNAFVVAAVARPLTVDSAGSARRPACRLPHQPSGECRRANRDHAAPLRPASGRRPGLHPEAAPGDVRSPERARVRAALSRSRPDRHVRPGARRHRGSLPRRSVFTWDQVAVPSAVRRHRIDVLYNPKYSIPLRAGCPAVWVCHGLDWYVMPWASRWVDRLSHRVLVPRYAARAAAIVAVSEITRDT